jgi:hypothetical protein|eukprot:COSAG01_NODE_7252_length_3281_cov_239.018542_2_plen_202_part_00
MQWRRGYRLFEPCTLAAVVVLLGLAATAAATREGGSGGGGGAAAAAAAHGLDQSVRYFVAAPCQGRFGNKIEYFLSGLARAKRLGLAAILPPVPTGDGDYWMPFDEVFSVQAMQEFLPGSIPVRQFLALHGTRWPEGKRIVLRSGGTHVFDDTGQRDKDRFWRYAVLTHDDVCVRFPSQLLSIFYMLIACCARGQHVRYER